MTDIVDSAVRTGHPGHVQAAKDWIEHKRACRDKLDAVGFSTARQHDEWLEDARARLEDALVDDPAGINEARRNQQFARLREAVDGVGESPSKPEPSATTTPAEPEPEPEPETVDVSTDESDTTPENPDGKMFWREGDRYDGHDHRGL